MTKTEFKKAMHRNTDLTLNGLEFSFWDGEGDSDVRFIDIIKDDINASMCCALSEGVWSDDTPISKTDMGLIEWVENLAYSKDLY